MKKTLIALAVIASGSAQASINLYDANGVSVDLSGAAEVQYADRDFDDQTRGDLRIDDADLQLNTTVKISDNLNAVAGMGFAYENTQVDADELWAGFSGDFGTLTFGRQLLISDDAGIGKDYELGYEQINFFDTASNSSIKYTFDNGMFYAGISHDINGDKEDKSITDGRVGVRFANLDTRIYVYEGKNLETGNTFKIDAKGYNLEAEYTLNNLSLAASYGQMEYKDSGLKAVTFDLDVFDVNAAYTIDKNTFALGYNRANGKGYIVGTDFVNGHSDNIYANVTHKFNSNVRIYAEMGWADNDQEPQKDLAYVAGMEVKF